MVASGPESEETRKRVMHEMGESVKAAAAAASKIRDFTQAAAARSRAQRYLSLLSGLLGLVTVAVTASYIVLKPGAPEPKPVPVLESRVQKLEESVATLNASLAQVSEQMRKVQETAQEKPLPTQMARISAQLELAQTDIAKLNAAIQQTPDKALAVPLLRKDFENMRDMYRHDLDNTQNEINRVYDQNKWFIGLMFTMAIGIIGLAVSNFLQARKPLRQTDSVSAGLE